MPCVGDTATVVLLVVLFLAGAGLFVVWMLERDERIRWQGIAAHYREESEFYRVEAGLAREGFWDDQPPPPFPLRPPHGG